MSIVTKTGDSGETGIVGPGRVSKSHERIHACGTVDELNALLGIVLAQNDVPDDVRTGLAQIQHQLFTLGADLATPVVLTVPRIKDEHLAALEAQITEWEQVLPALTQFILPSGSSAGAALHHARTVCRRAERWIVALKQQENINELALQYCNRLSDYLFLAARMMNREAKQEEVTVRYQ